MKSSALCFLNIVRFQFICLVSLKAHHRSSGTIESLSSFGSQLPSGIHKGSKEMHFLSSWMGGRDLWYSFTTVILNRMSRFECLLSTENSRSCWSAFLPRSHEYFLASHNPSRWISNLSCLIGEISIGRWSSASPSQGLSSRRWRHFSLQIYCSSLFPKNNLDRMTVGRLSIHPKEQDVSRSILNFRVPESSW